MTFTQSFNIQQGLQAKLLMSLSDLQVGQLYVWGLLRWLTPSSAMFQGMESSSWLAAVYTQPMYIANTGGATGALPITRPPSFAFQNSEGSRYQALLYGARSPVIMLGKVWAEQ